MNITEEDVLRTVKEKCGKMPCKNIKAVAAFSGGLDSTLAVKIVAEQGIKVIALNFMSPFCRCNKSKGCNSSAQKMAAELGAEFKAVYLGEEYLEILKNPKYGYGRNLNPCIDCRIFKFRLAKKVMEEAGASFIISGEVLGQRPMSQHRQALNTIERDSGLEGLILRPLSAKLFSPTIPEEKGWVLRDSLLAVSGRGRRPQINLAGQFGIKDFPCPAGGCLLTDYYFCKRLKDLFKYGVLNIENVELLKVGRHFRITEKIKFIVGRDESENKRILALARDNDLVFEPKKNPGPTGILKGKPDNRISLLAARIISRYTSPGGKSEVLARQGHYEQVICADSIDENTLKDLII